LVSVGASESSALVTERRTDRRTDTRTPLPLRSCSGRPPVGRALPSKVDGFANALPLRKKSSARHAVREKERVIKEKGEKEVSCIARTRIRIVISIRVF